MDNDFYDYVFNNKHPNTLLMKDYENIIIEKPIESVKVTLYSTPSRYMSEWCLNISKDDHELKVDSDFFLDSSPRDILEFFTDLIKHVSKSRTSL